MRHTYRWLLASSLILLLATAAYAAWHPVVIEITVDETKPDGSTWDQFRGKPDIALCLTFEDGKPKCYPRANSHHELAEPRCRDSFKCRFGPLRGPKLEEFEVMVVDVDSAINEIIGKKVCKRQAPCDLGSAKVILR